MNKYKVSFGESILLKDQEQSMLSTKYLHSKMKLHGLALPTLWQQSPTEKPPETHTLNLPHNKATTDTINPKSTEFNFQCKVRMSKH